MFYFQLRAVQFEWNQNWKVLNEKSPLFETEPAGHPSRHQKVLKQHIIHLEKRTKGLHKENYFLKAKFLRMEEEIKELQNELRAKQTSKGIYDRINGNEIENFINQEKIKEVKSVPNKEISEKLLNVTKQQKINTISIRNLTKQSSNFDKLRLSILELLENVETIENKVEKTVPEFRSEISKLEIQVSETSSAISLLKEDQRNIIDSLKAIGFSVSNMQDKTNEDHKHLEKLDTTIENILRSSNIQTSKLHDHILKVKYFSSNGLNILN